jgi:hypothetical protein
MVTLILDTLQYIKLVKLVLIMDVELHQGVPFRMSREKTSLGF